MIDTGDLEKELRAVLRDKLDRLIRDEEIIEIASASIDSLLEEKINNVLNHLLNGKSSLSKISNLIEDKYSRKIQESIDLEVKQKVSNSIARVDLGSEISDRLDKFISDRVKSFDLPDASIPARVLDTRDLNITADMIRSGTYSRFTSTGIQDISSQIELTVADNIVVAEHTLASRDLQIEESANIKNLTAENITVTGALKLGQDINREITSMIQNHIVESAKNLKIDVLVNPILANGKTILSENTLGPSVIHSNIRKLGRLTDLSVSGFANINDSLIVTESGKVGINTESPEGALTIWDDDSEITIKKHRKKAMYIGSTRDCDLVLGAGNDSKLEIRRDGAVHLNRLNINGLEISVSDKIPEHAGSPGDLVFISRPRENEPWAYRCLGSSVWRAL